MVKGKIGVVKVFLHVVAPVCKNELLAAREERITKRLAVLEAERLILLKNALIEMVFLVQDAICTSGLGEGLGLHRVLWIRCSILK